MIDINTYLNKAVIALNNTPEFSIQILDASGALIETLEIKDSQFIINYSRYKKGIYSLRLETSNKTILKTFEIS